MSCTMKIIRNQQNKTVTEKNLYCLRSLELEMRETISKEKNEFLTAVFKTR